MTTETATPQPAAAVPAPVVGENIDARKRVTLASVGLIVALAGEATTGKAGGH